MPWIFFLVSVGFLLGYFFALRVLVVVTVIIMAYMYSVRPRHELGPASFVASALVAEGCIFLLVMWLTTAISLGWFPILYDQLDGLQILR